MPLWPASVRRAAIIGAAGVVLLSAALIGWLRREAPTMTCCPGAGPAALNDPIVSDLKVRSDTLPNGLRYYVYANPSSGTRAELRLVVNAGSVLEDDDQRGLAHAVEHMVLSGTRRFPRGAVANYLESIGMRRGEGVNATTTLDETVYRIVVPTDRPGAVDTALAMLAGVAHEATFDSADRRREAGVLLEEWRSKRDAFQRVTDARHSLIFAGTQYASRPVLGDTSVLRRFDVGAMRRFYETWYRPELMTVVAVGDFDEGEVERMLTRHFGGMRRSENRRHRPSPAPPAKSSEFRASVVTDPEATNTWIGFWYPRPPLRYQRRSDYRTALVAAMWRSVLRARLEDASLEAGSSIISSGVENRLLAQSLAAHVVSAIAMKDRALDALETVAAEVERLARHGATRQEVDERARAMLRHARSAAESGNASADLAAEFVDHFLTGNVTLSSRTTYELTRDILPTVTADDVTAFARGLSVDSGAAVIAAATTDDPVGKASPEDLIARTRTAMRRPVPPPRHESDVRRLLVSEPTMGRVVSERAIPDVRAYEWTLSNDMRVILKPTRFSFDEIQLRAVAPGGASLASDADYPSAYLADVIIEETGLGRMSGRRLDRWLESTSITMAPTVTNDAVTIDGQTARRDLHPFFQLLHLYLTAPRSDTVAFRRYQDRLRSLVRDRGRDPEVVFLDTVAALLAGGHPRALKSSARFLDSASLTKALEFWTRRVSNGAGFTVVLTGDFTLDRVRPLIERYLASLPRGAREQPASVGARIVTGTAHREVDSGIGGSARTVIGFSGPLELTNDAINALGATRDVIEHALGERLRERLGGTYGVHVGLETDVVPPARYTMRIDFEAAPERIESLAAAALAELERLRRHGPTEAQFLKTRAGRIRDYDGKMDDNDYWTSELSIHARFDWPLATIAKHPRDAERLTLADLRAACDEYIPSGQYVRVTMRPRSTRASVPAR